jgi:8-hydroxy-5-deazaflavin:NADPH oxidoreductase
MAFMKIAVIGAGHIGGTIGARWEEAGHEVVYGLRDPTKKAGARSIADSLSGAAAVLFAVPGSAMKSLVDDHKSQLDAKVILDATNDFRGETFHQWQAHQKAVPNAHFFRVFNTYGWEVFANPKIGGETPDLFYAGPEESRDTVEKLISDVGLRPVWVGGPDLVETVDGVLRLWVTLSRRLGRRIALKLLTD